MELRRQRPAHLGRHHLRRHRQPTIHGGYGNDAISGGEALPSVVPADRGRQRQRGHCRERLVPPLQSRQHAPIQPHRSGRRARSPQGSEQDGAVRPLRRVRSAPQRSSRNADKTPYAGTFRSRRRSTSRCPGSSTSTPARPTARSRLFGDLGGDWIMAGTGQNDIYGRLRQRPARCRRSRPQDIDGGPEQTQPNDAMDITNEALGGAGKDVLDCRSRTTPTG